MTAPTFDLACWKCDAPQDDASLETGACRCGARELDRPEPVRPAPRRVGYPLACARCRKYFYPDKGAWHPRCWDCRRRELALAVAP